MAPAGSLRLLLSSISIKFSAKGHTPELNAAECQTKPVVAPPSRRASLEKSSPNDRQTCEKTVPASLDTVLPDGNAPLRHDSSGLAPTDSARSATANPIVHVPLPDACNSPSIWRGDTARRSHPIVASRGAHGAANVLDVNNPCRSNSSGSSPGAQSASPAPAFPDTATVPLDRGARPDGCYKSISAEMPSGELISVTAVHADTDRKRHAAASRRRSEDIPGEARELLHVALDGNDSEVSGGGTDAAAGHDWTSRPHTTSAPQVVGLQALASHFSPSPSPPAPTRALTTSTLKQLAKDARARLPGGFLSRGEGAHGGSERRMPSRTRGRAFGTSSAAVSRVAADSVRGSSAHRGSSTHRASQRTSAFVDDSGTCPTSVGVGGGVSNRNSLDMPTSITSAFQPATHLLQPHVLPASPPLQVTSYRHFLRDGQRQTDAPRDESPTSAARSVGTASNPPYCRLAAARLSCLEQAVSAEGTPFVERMHAWLRKADLSVPPATPPAVSPARGGGPFSSRTTPSVPTQGKTEAVDHDGTQRTSGGRDKKRRGLPPQKSVPLPYKPRLLHSSRLTNVALLMEEEDMHMPSASPPTVPATTTAVIPPQASPPAPAPASLDAVEAQGARQFVKYPSIPPRMISPAIMDRCTAPPQGQQRTAAGRTATASHTSALHVSGAASTPCHALPPMLNSSECLQTGGPRAPSSPQLGDHCVSPGSRSNPSALPVLMELSSGALPNQQYRCTSMQQAGQAAGAITWFNPSSAGVEGATGGGGGTGRADGQDDERDELYQLWSWPDESSGIELFQGAVANGHRHDDQADPTMVVASTVRRRSAAGEQDCQHERHAQEHGTMAGPASFIADRHAQLLLAAGRSSAPGGRRRPVSPTRTRYAAGIGGGEDSGGGGMSRCAPSPPEQHNRAAPVSNGGTAVPTVVVPETDGQRRPYVNTEISPYDDAQGDTPAGDVQGRASQPAMGDGLAAAQHDGVAGPGGRGDRQTAPAARHGRGHARDGVSSTGPHELGGVVNGKAGLFSSVRPSARVQPLLKSKTSTRSIAVATHCPRELRSKEWHIEDFVLVRKLYEGERSVVCHARHGPSGRHCAVKIYKRSRMQEMERFQLAQEICLHVRVLHPFIVAMHAAWKDDKYVYLLMEWLPGGNLYDFLMSRGGRMAEAEAAAMVVKPLLTSLSFIHTKHYIHRDVKLENILVDAGSSVKLVDFGLAIDQQMDPASGRPSAVSYPAPEMLDCPLQTSPLPPPAAKDLADSPPLRYCDKVDVWGAGVVAYELVVGRPPFAADCTAKVREAIRHRQLMYPDTLSPEARDFLTSALQRDPSLRPTARQLLDHPWLQRTASTATNSKDAALVAGPKESGC